MNVCALSVLWLLSLAEPPHSPVQLDEKIERGNYWHRFHSCVQSNEWLSSNVQTLFFFFFFVNCSEFSGLRREFQPVWFFQCQFGRADLCPGPARALKDFFLGPEIFVRWLLKMNNLICFRAIVHELKTVDITALLPLLTPASSQFTLNSCDTGGPRGLSSVLWRHHHWVTLC